ncbi:MAG: hypothetical protein EOP84_37145, partial [Verrucomicrobiaceae bacterium]
MLIKKIYTPRNVCQVRATLFSIGAVALAVYILQSDETFADLEGECVILAILVLCAAYQWFSFRRIPKEAVFYDIDDAPPEEQIHVSKRVLWLMPLIGAVPTVWTYLELRSLEDGSSQSVMLWGPVAMIYENLGFWPAALCFPVLVLFIVVLSVYRIERSKARIGFGKADW